MEASKKLQQELGDRHHRDLSAARDMEAIEKLQQELGMEFGSTVELNNLSFCEPHYREICHDCRLELPDLNAIAGFKLPDDGRPQYPRVELANISDHCKDLLAARWLNVQRALYSKPKPESWTLTADMIVLSPVEGSDDVKCSPSPSVMQETLLRLFQQAQGIASTQRFDFAGISQILLQDYETFSDASLLYKEMLADIHGRLVGILRRRQDLSPTLTQLKIDIADREKAISTILSTFSFFLDLKTQHSFWRCMELTAEGFGKHVEMFNDEVDCKAVLTNAAKHALLEWIGHMFWSLHHAQFQLQGLWSIQHEVYNRDSYPFYPYDLEALEAGFDVYLVIMKLCKAELHDFGSVPLLLKELQEASKFTKQMQFVNSRTMAAIDEFSTRLRMLQVLYYAAQLVASEDEIKFALLLYPFNPEGEELHAKTLDVLSGLCGLREKLPTDLVKMFSRLGIPVPRPPPPENPSFLQSLIMMENAFRKQHSTKMSSISGIDDNLEDDTMMKKMFDAFKPSFYTLYRNHIRPKWKDYECSLLPLHVMKRIQHRRDVEKERRLKNKRSGGELCDGNDRQVAMTGKERCESKCVDATLFWEVGDGSIEPYVPLVLRKKIKTSKEGSTDANREGLADVKMKELFPRIDVQELEAEALVVSLQPRMLDQLKNTDFNTWDTLWGKEKGRLKWSSLLQFLTRVGCKILSLDGSKKKVVDLHTGLSTILHMPHPEDECRIHQRKLYCDHLKHHLKIRHQDLKRVD